MSVSGETPFQISISDSELSTLHQKLSLTSFPDELEDAGRDYGAPLADLRRLIDYWKNGYDWRKQEAALNTELPQFTREIEVDGFGTFTIHYVHKKSTVTNAIPLLFVHGWPGSFIEVRKILPLLIEASPDYPSFHVVALSLPGYGFSSAPTKKGFKLPQYAEIGNKLMLGLGYDEYVTQGGDWGYFVTREIGSRYGPKHSKAWHTNFPVPEPPSLRNPWPVVSHLLSYLPFFSYSAREKEGLARTMEFKNRGRGFVFLQSTKPQTIGYALTDSPVGLLAWIYEKLVDATDEYPWQDDEVLTWISIYYFSRAGPAASLRIYYELIGTGEQPQLPDIPAIPAGYSYFPKEAFQLPRSWTRIRTLIFESEHEHGGHFAAYEKPLELVTDLRRMFGKGGGAFGVVKGKYGYDTMST